MSHPVTLYLVRHGQTEFNLKGLAQGWSNSPLTDAGQEGAARLGAGLAREGVRFGLACSSDSGRAVDTARLILTHAGQADLPRRQDPRLRERCMGDFEAGPVDAFLEAFAAKFPGDPLHPDRFHALPDWADCLLEHNSEGAVQTFDAICQRLMEGLEDLMREAEEAGIDNVLVVSHGLAIKTVLYILARDRMDEAGNLKNTSVCTFRWDGTALHPLVLNDTHYLEG